MRRFYAESTASELAWNDCPEFGHLRLCNHSPDIPLVRRCDPHTPSYIKSGYQRSRASLPTAAALLVSSPNLEHGVPGGQESAPDLPSGLRYLSLSLPGVRGRPPSSPATPVRPHEPPAHPRAPAARHTSPPQSVPRSSLSPRPTPIPPHEHETTTTPTNSTPSPSQLPLAHSSLFVRSLAAYQDRATRVFIVNQSIIGIARWNRDIAIKQRTRFRRTA